MGKYISQEFLNFTAIIGQSFDFFLGHTVYFTPLITCTTCAKKYPKRTLVQFMRKSTMFQKNVDDAKAGV